MSKPANSVAPAADAKPSRPFQFLDFCPKITDRTTLEGRTKFEKVSDLIDRINKWLHNNLQYDVLSIESVQVSRGEVIPQITPAESVSRLFPAFPITANTPNNYIRGLRLWLTYNPTKLPAAGGYVKYLTVVPNLKLLLDKSTRKLGYGTGDTRLLFASANAFISASQVKGKYVGAETFCVYLSADRLNPEITAWSVDKNRPDQVYAEALRIYYLEDDTMALPASLSFIDLLPPTTKPPTNRAIATVKPADAKDNVNSTAPLLINELSSPSNTELEVSERTSNVTQVPVSTKSGFPVGAVKSQLKTTLQIGNDNSISKHDVTKGPLDEVVDIWQRENINQRILYCRTFMSGVSSTVESPAGDPADVLKKMDEVAQSVAAVRVFYFSETPKPRKDNIDSSTVTK